MQRGFVIYFYVLLLGLSVTAADDSTVSKQPVLQLIKEKSLDLFVHNFGFAPFLSSSYDNILPLADFLKVKEDSQNIVSVFKSSQIGDTKRGGANSKKYAIIGNPQCFEVCVGKNKELIVIPLGSIQNINNPESKLQKVLEYTGHCKPIAGQQKRSKAVLAFQLAQEFDKENKTDEAELWYLRSIDAGNGVIAPYYFAQLLEKKLANFRFDERIASRRQAFSAITKIYQILSQEVGHLGSMRESAGLLERFGYFAEAGRWYKKCAIEKGHVSSIKNMVGCANMLWEPWIEDGATPPDDTTLTSIKEFYALAAYKFGDEEGINKLADLMQEYDCQGNDDDCFSLEKEVLMKHIDLCGDRVSSNTILRLALLHEASYKMRFLASERESHKIYEIFLPAAQAGNFPAMVKLYQLSKKEGCEDLAELWFNKINIVCNDILRESKIKNCLLYLTYLEKFGQELLEDVCSELEIDSSLLRDNMYSFEPTVELPRALLPSKEEENSFKRKREDDEDCDPDTKRMRRNEFEQ